MELAGIFHHPFSADAYVYDKETMHLKLRTKRRILPKFYLFGVILIYLKRMNQGNITGSMNS